MDVAVVCLKNGRWSFRSRGIINLVTTIVDGEGMFGSGSTHGATPAYVVRCCEKALVGVKYM